MCGVAGACDVREINVQLPGSKHAVPRPEELIKVQLRCMPSGGQCELVPGCTGETPFLNILQHSVVNEMRLVQCLSDEAVWKRLNPDPPDNYVPDAHERYIIRLEAEAQARGVKPY